MLAPQGQAIRSSLTAPAPSRKRPWEDEHHSRRLPLARRNSQHFITHIIDTPRHAQQGWADSPPKTHRSDAHAYHQYANEGQQAQQWQSHRDEGIEVDGDDRRTAPGPPSHLRDPYVTATWPRTEGSAGSYARLSPPGELVVHGKEEDLRARVLYYPPAYQDTRPHPENYGQPPPRQAQAPTQLQPSHQPQQDDETNGGRHNQEPYRYPMPSTERPTLSVLENRSWSQSTQPRYHNPNTSNPAEPAQYQPQHHPSTSPKAQNDYQHLNRQATQSNSKISISDAKCSKCKTSRVTLTTFQTQVTEIFKLFALFGDFQIIHEEYSDRGVKHDDIPGFAEMHRITDLVTEASKLAGYMLQIGPLMEQKLAYEKDGKDGKVSVLENELLRLKRDLALDLAELDREGALRDGSPSSRRSWTAEYKTEVGAEYPREQQPRRLSSIEMPATSHLGHLPFARMQPPPPPPQPQQELSPASSNDRGKAMTPSPNPYTSAPLPSATEHGDRNRPVSGTANTYRPLSPAYTTIVSANPSMSTFKLDPSPNTLEAKVKKLKDRLETEIAEVDNLTEEKKRLEDRCKELEGVVEEERAKRREVVDMNMKERMQFLGVMEGVVSLGRREGDVKTGSGMMVKKESDGDEERNENGGVEGRTALQREVERLRERVRVCEGALEHIQREARHMEDTVGKVNESRKGIDLVLGRVLAGGTTSASSAVAVVIE